MTEQQLDIDSVVGMGIEFDASPHGSHLFGIIKTNSRGEIVIDTDPDRSMIHWCEVTQVHRLWGHRFDGGGSQ